MLNVTDSSGWPGSKKLKKIIIPWETKVLGLWGHTGTEWGCHSRSYYWPRDPNSNFPKLLSWNRCFVYFLFLSCTIPGSLRGPVRWHGDAETWTNFSLLLRVLDALPPYGELGAMRWFLREQNPMTNVNRLSSILQLWEITPIHPHSHTASVLHTSGRVSPS